MEGVAGFAAVLLMGGGVLVLEGEVKWIVRVAGDEVSVERLTVMGIAGLWYLSRGRHRRQKCLGEGVSRAVRMPGEKRRRGGEGEKGRGGHVPWAEMSRQSIGKIQMYPCHFRWENCCAGSQSYCE